MQSASATYSWGSSPGEATIVYDAGAVPVTVGWYVQLAIAGHAFNGMCIDDTASASSGGNKRILHFVDNRYWLSKDQVYCSFNQLDDKIVNNVRVKRYVHHIPDLNYEVVLNPAGFQPRNFLYDANENLVAPIFPAGPYYLSGGIKTYTTCPLTSAQIIAFLLNATTVRDVWTVNLHPDMYNNPVWDLDATGGKTLAAMLQEISDQQGLLFTNMGGAFNLFWIRKGFWDARFPTVLPFLPPAETNPATGELQVLADDIVQGDAISDNPTNILLLGDRNVYMPLNIPMQKDWSPGWDQFWSEEFFVNDIYTRGSTQQDVTLQGVTFPAGTAFATIGASKQDPEQILARQMARAYALSITVAQYAQLRGENLFVDPPNFADYRKFAGKTRLDMPAILYMQKLLLRAFRFPDGFTITNQLGVNVPLDSMEIMDKMIARVTFDPVTGTMTANPNQTADGNGLALIQGYQVGQSMFEKINPDRFNLAAWIGNAPNIWQAAQFEVDDSGEPGGKFIVFDSPIFKSATFFSQLDWMRGYYAYNMQPKKADGTLGLDIPNVQCTLCFQMERFYYFQTGTIAAGATETYQIGGLNTELVFPYGTTDEWVEIPYSDGLLSAQKAALFIAPLLLSQLVYAKGGYKHPLNISAEGNYPTATALNPIIDKITVELSPNGGVSETINFTTEYPKLTYTPERDLDRNTKLLTLLPGQQQLRQQAIIQQEIVSGLVQLPTLRQTMATAFKGIIGQDAPIDTVPVLAAPVAPATAPAVQNLNVGTPLWGLPPEPATTAGGARSNTVAVPPTATTPTAQHSVFRGVTVQHNWPAGDGRDIPIQNTGRIYVRVMGPVQAGQPVGQVAATGAGVIPDYLSPSASSNFVGTAQEAIATATVALIAVQVGSTLPSEAAVPFEVLKVSETQVMISPDSALLAGLNITGLVPIFGLGLPFTVQNGTLIYLEVLFDINNNPIFANIAIGGENDAQGTQVPSALGRTGWRTGNASGQQFVSASGFPSLIGTVDENNLASEKTIFATESQFWVEDDDAISLQNYNTAEAALALFTSAYAPARYQAFYSYSLIGFCTNSPGASGITLQGSNPNEGTAFTVVQSVETNLMLQGFCSGGVPSQLPVPYSGPDIIALPPPTISALSSENEITITMPAGYTSATIMYSLDGAAFQQYTGSISVFAEGTHTIKAYAMLAGYFNSTTVSQTFTVSA